MRKNLVGFDLDAVAYLPHKHGGRTLEHLGQDGLVLGGKMKDDHERHAAVRGHGTEERLQGVQPARRATEAHDRQLGVALRGHHVVDGLAFFLLDVVGESGGKPSARAPGEPLLSWAGAAAVAAVVCSLWSSGDMARILFDAKPA